MPKSIAVEHNIIVLNKNAFAETCLDEKTGERFLRSLCRFKTGAVVTPFKASKYYTSPNVYTIQAGEESHISLFPIALHYTNHSCLPNVFFDYNSMDLVAISEIEPGDSLCFFYPSTEWEMASPFVCQCGSDACLGKISGAIDVPVNILSTYRLSDFIRKKISG
jgi:hypothetical protein